MRKRWPQSLFTTTTAKIRCISAYKGCIYIAAHKGAKKCERSHLMLATVQASYVMEFDTISLAKDVHERVEEFATPFLTKKDPSHKKIHGFQDEGTPISTHPLQFQALAYGIEEAGVHLQTRHLPLDQLPTIVGRV
ncbi:hypothetical protein AMTR_s00001p00257010 [Amborella trichopoda]|uniref:Uncharacterized protein n=1 Tax=Amborella trichopoda TaxID=13333 RepID=W1NMF3_AMBTC|nr:hypothetical protein AMTR_s00001p00257010 [Amborella trichopoda]